MTLTVSQTYTGEGALDILTKAFFEGKTLAGNYVTVHTGIKDKLNVSKLTSGDILQDDACTWDASGDLTLSEMVLHPNAIKVNTQACAIQLESSWQSSQLRAGANNSDLQPIQNYINDIYVKKVAEDLDRQIWQGDTAGTDQLDGFRKIILAGKSGTPDVEGVTLSAANILTEIGKLYDAIPAQVRDSQDMKIFISKEAESFYKRALASSSGDANFAVYGDKPLDYLGIELVPVRLEADTMVAAEMSNLHFGTDLMADMNEVRIIDMRESDGSEFIRYKMRFKAGVQYGFIDEITIYADTV